MRSQSNAWLSKFRVGRHFLSDVPSRIQHKALEMVFYPWVIEVFETIYEWTSGKRYDILVRVWMRCNEPWFEGNIKFKRIVSFEPIRRKSQISFLKYSFRRARRELYFLLVRYFTIDGLGQLTFQSVAQPGILSLIVVATSEAFRMAKLILPSHGQLDFCSSSTVVSPMGILRIAEEYKCTAT